MKTFLKSLVPGLLLGWLALWDTGIIHERDPVGVAWQVLVMLAGVAVCWLWLRYWDRLAAWLEWG